MKKLSHKQRENIILKARYGIELQTLINKQKKPHTSKKYKSPRPPGTSTFQLPETFRMLNENTRTELTTIIAQIDRALKEGRTAKLDFTKVAHLFPCGTLVFLANFDRWADIYPNKIIGTYPADNVVEQLLQRVGVIKRLGLEERCEITHERVKFWHYKSGKTVDPASYQDLALTVLKNIAHPYAELFADCLNEAVSNSVGHAYDFELSGLPPESHRKWWVLSSLRDDHVFVAIYDSGVTIPASIRRKPEWIEYLRLLPRKDAQIISLVVTSNKTSTRLPHRGKGLPEMLEFSQQLASGSLSIASGHGAYRHDAETGRDKRSHLACPINGTLVLWQIPFREERKDG